MATDKRSGSRSGPPSSPSLEAGSLRRTGRRGWSPEVWKGLCPRPASLCRPPVEPRPAQGPLQALLRCHLSPFPGPVSCPLSCEDPHHTHLPCENHLNGTSATTPFQKGSQMGFWEVGPQHRLHKIPPTQAPPPGPQGWGRGAGQAGAQGARCPLGSCGRGCWGHLPPPGNQDLRAQRWAACSPPSPRAASPSQGWAHRGPRPAGPRRPPPRSAVWSPEGCTLFWSSPCSQRLVTVPHMAAFLG